MARILLPYNTHDHEMTIIKEIRDPIARLTNSHAGPLIDVTLVTDIDHARIQEITTITRYTFYLGPPSRSRDSRSSRSRSHSNTKNKPNTIHPQTQNDPINFEVRMYHPTEMTNAVTPTSWFYSLYTHTSSDQIQRNYPSRLEISFFWIAVYNLEKISKLYKFYNTLI